MTIPEIPLTSSNSIPWRRDALPSEIRQASLDHWRKAHSMLNLIAEEVSAPFRDNGQFEDRRILRPKPSFGVRNLPGGILYLSDELPQQSIMLDREVSRLAGSELVLWSIGFENYGSFICQYDELSRDWIKKDFIFNPLVISSQNQTFAIYIDDQLRFTRIFGDENDLKIIDDVFGGKNEIEKLFNSYVEDQGVGFGPSDLQWSREHLIAG